MKTPESLSNATPEASQELLSIEDKKLLEYTLHKFLSYLEGLDKNKMPAVLIFPETSTRPLIYALKPVIEKAYAEKGVPLPDYRFIATVRNPEREEVGIADDADQEKIASLREEMKKIPQKSFTTWEEYEEAERKRQQILPQKRQEYQRASGWDGARRDRFKEILTKSKRGNILVVDDFLSAYETFDQIEACTDLLPEDVSLEYFALVDMRGNNYQAPRRNYDERLHTCLNHLSRSNPNLEFTTLLGVNSLSYAGRAKASWEASNKPIGTLVEKQAVIGVKVPYKPALHSERASANPTLMKKLREEMGRIGKEVASNPSFNEKAWKESLPFEFPDV